MHSLHCKGILPIYHKSLIIRAAEIAQLVSLERRSLFRPWSSEPCQGRGREGYGNASEFDGEALEPRVEHPFRDDMPDAAGDDVEQAFADEVLTDDEGDFADGDAGVAVRWSSVLPDDGPEVPALLFGEECGVQLGDDGVAAVGVHYPHEGVYAAGLVFGAGPAAAVAEVEDLAAEAVALLEYPQAVGGQTVGRHFAHGVQLVGRGDVRHEFLIVQWYFQQALLLQRSGQDGHVNFRRQQFLHDEAGAHLGHAQMDGRVLFVHPPEESGEDVGGNGRDDAHDGLSALVALLDGDYLLDLRGVVQGHPGLGDDLLSEGGGSDGVGSAVKYGHVQGGLDAADARAEGRLGDAAGLGGPDEVAVGVHCDDVAQGGNAEV